MNPPGKSRNQFAYYADEGVTNNVVVRLAGAFYTIDDIVPIDAGMGCTHPDGDLTFVSCDAAGVTIIDIRTKDGNDTVNNMSPMSAYVLGGDGNDAIWGGVADDYLYGGEGNDQLRGGPGDDTLEGNPGSDYMIGGDGSYDQASYRGSAAGVIADLIGDAGDGVPGENDTITSDVEILVGSDHNDVLYGNDQMNFLYGGRGQDVLNGLGGNDFLTGENQYGYTTTLFADEFHGGTGRDTVDYTDHSAAQRVFADADGALGDDGATGEHDTIYSDVENLVGSPGPDFLTGNDSANSIWGGAGDDIITGLDGPDRLRGDAGNDTIYGGEGDDLLEGGDGNDNLYGQRGVDELHGGAGTDVCDEVCD